jgi:calcineurin-like phosphoesterase family protein
MKALEWLAGRPGTKHLVSGNHDGVHPMHHDSHKKFGPYLEVFASVQQSARRKLAGYEVLLSHFPFLGSEDAFDTYNRFEQWRLPQMGSWLLHGHTHSRVRSHGRSIHVGVDAWDLKPVSVNAIAAIVMEFERRQTSYVDDS